LLTVLINPKTEQRRLCRCDGGSSRSGPRDADNGYRTINAKAESIDTEPAFRDAFQRRRCLVPTNGFHEWKKDGTTKQPYLLTMADGNLFAFAGLWERWRDPVSGERCLPSPSSRPSPTSWSHTSTTACRPGNRAHPRSLSFAAAAGAPEIEEHATESQHHGACRHANFEIAVARTSLGDCYD
jgi:putative SOS response-associated peptidase YedK